MGVGLIFSDMKNLDNITQIKNWIDTFNIRQDDSWYIEEYLKGKICFGNICISKEQNENKEAILNLAEQFCNILINKPLCEYARQLEKIEKTIIISPCNIPQFSQLIDGTSRITDILVRSGNIGMSLKEIGEYLTEPGKKEAAYRKYGENHSKFAEFLDLVFIDRSKRPFKVYINPLGEVFRNLKEIEKQEVILRLYFKIPVVQKILLEAQRGSTTISEHLTSLSKSTIDRRRSNVKKLIKGFYNYSDNKMNEWLERIEMR